MRRTLEKALTRAILAGSVNDGADRPGRGGEDGAIVLEAREPAPVAA